MKAYEALVALAAEQHGLFRTQDAVGASVTKVSLHRMVADGRIEPLSRGLYRVPALPQDRLTPYMEAVLWANGHAAVSHASALEMQELCDLIPNRIHINVPSTYNPRRGGGGAFRVHRRQDYAPGGIDYYEGVPVVRAYCAVDEAFKDGEDPQQLRLAVRNAAERGLLLRDEINELETRLP